VIAISGLIITEFGIYLGWLRGQEWMILATGFEAATIGALADWFAVSALFHRIPIPLVSRHTNIIVKNRQKLTEAIVELVTTKWLSSDIIQEKLQGVQIAEALLKFLEKTENMDRVLDLLRNLLNRFSENLDNPQVASLAQRLIKDQLADTDIASPLGHWLEGVVHEKEHFPIVDLVLDQSMQTFDELETRELIGEKLKWAMKSYGRQDWVKKSAIWIGKKTGGIDLDLLTDRLLDIARMMATDARQNPEHPLRQKLDSALLEFAQNLKNGDPATLEFINRLKTKIVEDTRTQSILLDFLSRLKITFTEQLKNSETTFMKLLRNNMERLIRELKGDTKYQEKIDHWIKGTVAMLINKYHHEIGNMVRSSLLKLDDKSLVAQIKEKVGDDLQYIRLNGALVGGLVGIFIALFKILLLK
jgi:uncharacterized membrane-anchored protein YjiN (DUF445 family)